MFLQRLTKSYSNSLPVYEPLPSNTHSNGLQDHETGSFSCAYSPQHSVGAARVIVQSAQIRKSKGWRRFFRVKPSAWVKVKALGRTMGGVVNEGEERTEIKTWREERAVGSTDICPATYTPNFGFKSFYTLLGPYEKQFELEVRNKRNWLWPFQSPSLMGSATFMLPSHLVPSPVTHSKNSLLGLEYSDHEGAINGHSTPSPGGQMRSLSPTTTHHHDEKKPRAELNTEELTGEWAVQAPLFNHDMTKIQGYLQFNVFWYPAVPAPFPGTRPDMRPPQGAEEGDEGGGSSDSSQNKGGPGIVTFTLHSIDDLDTPHDRGVAATISLGWHYPPLHTVGGVPGSDLRNWASQSSSDTSTESLAYRREVRRTQLQSRAECDSRQQPAGRGDLCNKKFDSTFEFLCMDPLSTNLVLKVYEVYRGNVVLEMGKRKREFVGHTSVPLLDLIGGQCVQDGVDRIFDELDLQLRISSVEGGKARDRIGRDRVLPLLGHPTGKVKICVEWRALRIPEVQVLAKTKCG